MSTIAYLSDKTGEEIHTFTLGEGVDIELIWDERIPDVFYPEKEYPEKHAYVTIPDTAMKYEYVGVKVQFFKEEEARIDSQNVLQFKKTNYSTFANNYGKIISYAKEATEKNEDIDITETLNAGTRSGWREYTAPNNNKSSDSDDGTIYLYCGNNTNGDLAQVFHGSSLWIFDSIRINEDCSQKYATNLPEGSTIKLYNQDGTYYAERTIGYDQLKGFRIVITAYAVQGDIPAAEAKTALINMIKGN